MSETPLRRFRILQIRALAVFLSSMGERSAGCRGIVRLRSDTWARSLINAALAYRRTFSSFAEAQACASSFIQAGHEHPDEIRYHTSISDTVRESDYPVLFHLAPLACQLQRIFDFGGNVGNLFYAYQREVNFSPNLTWSVYDLPVKKPLGEKVAAERGGVAEHRAMHDRAFVYRLQRGPSGIGRVHRDAELAIFRILQESLTNIHRHSGSSTAQVRLIKTDREVTIEIHDQGTGIPAPVLESAQDACGTIGVGLRGMTERMRQLGGKLEVISGATGTTVRAIVSCQ